MQHTLRTLAHATLVLVEDGVPLIATDPWLVGSVYWRSWWLERDPTEEEVALVRNARHVYLTHSHPDHLHLPSLRHLGKPSTLHPQFPGYKVPSYLAEQGFPSRVLAPWHWYRLTPHVRIMSVPTFLDDSILVLDTPHAFVFNLNDTNPPARLLRELRRFVGQPAKRVVALKSYSPASAGVSTFCDGRRVPHRDKKAYVRAAQEMAETIGAELYVPFASQAFFGRPDSKWANEYKVQYSDLREHWNASGIQVAPPFVSLDLETLKYTSSYTGPRTEPNERQRLKIAERDREEAAFALPGDFDEKLERYHGQVPFLRWVYPRGIGWRLATSGSERFYNARSGRLERAIPAKHDFVVTVPDKILYESLCNNVLTDLGITMIIRVDTQRDIRVTYGAFLAMGMHDYGYFDSVRRFLSGMAYYVPFVAGTPPTAARESPLDSPRAAQQVTPSHVTDPASSAF